MKRINNKVHSEIYRGYSRISASAQNPIKLSRELRNAGIKRVKSRTWRSAEFVLVIDALNFRIYVSRPFSGRYHRLAGSSLATFVRYRKSWFSIIVKSQECNLDTPVVIRRNCNEASGEERSLYVLRERACMCVSECPILPRRKLSQVPQKRLNCYRQSPKFFIN